MVAEVILLGQMAHIHWLQYNQETILLSGLHPAGEWTKKYTDRWYFSIPWWKAVKDYLLMFSSIFLSINLSSCCIMFTCTNEVKHITDISDMWKWIRKNYIFSVILLLKFISKVIKKAKFCEHTWSTQINNIQKENITQGYKL